MTAKLVFFDTETTALTVPWRRGGRRVWEVGLIVRNEDGEQGEYQWYVGDPSLKHADPKSLEIGRFFERHPQYGGDAAAVDSPWAVSQQVMELTWGAHMVGAVPWFDDASLEHMMRQHGAVPGWHYHLIDVEALAIGWLAGSGKEFVAKDGTQSRGLPLPWNSDLLVKAMELDPIPEEERHTALGDARLAMRIYDKVMGI